MINSVNNGVVLLPDLADDSESAPFSANAPTNSDSSEWGAGTQGVSPRHSADVFSDMTNTGGSTDASGMSAGEMMEKIVALLMILLEKVLGIDPDSATAEPSDVGAGPATSLNSSNFDLVVDDAAGTLFTTTGADGREIAAKTDSNNNLIIDGVNYGDVDDDKLSFSTDNDQLTVMKDGKALSGFNPIELKPGSNANLVFENVEQNSQRGSITLNEPTHGTSQFFSESTPRANDGGFGSTEIREDVTPVGPITPVKLSEGSMSASEYLSSSLEGPVAGLEKQKFQYGGYDKEDVTTLNKWEDVLATGVVKENSDGSITLTTSKDVPRNQAYPDDDVEGGRQATKVSDLKDMGFDFSIDGWEEGEAAWIHELHKKGDGQAFAFGFNQEGNLLMSNGDEQLETDIPFVDAGGVNVNYEGNTAHVSVLNKDGTVRGTESMEIKDSEVHVKALEVYNRRAAADTSVAVTFNNFRFGE